LKLNYVQFQIHFWYLSTTAEDIISNKNFYAPHLVPPGTAEARISYGISVCPSVCLSVRPSVTTRYRFNARWDRDSGSSPYDSLEYL